MGVSGFIFTGHLDGDERSFKMLMRITSIQRSTSVFVFCVIIEFFFQLGTHLVNKIGQKLTVN